jgi:Restriction endonuclease/NACHT domain
MNKAEPKEERGSGLEREVERIYRLLGAVTRRRVLIKGYEIDVHAEFRKGPLSFTVLVECKEYSAPRSVSDLDMRSFVAKVLATRECGAADKGVFVTSSSYAKTALATAEQHGIQCLRLEELHNQLVDFSPYLTALQVEFQVSDLSRWYIDQAVSDLEDYDSLTSETRSTYIHPSLLEYADDVLFTRNEPRLAILGNFGTGKTSFCEKYRDTLAARAQQNAIARIPVLINLREFRSGLDIHQVITNSLQRLPAVTIDLSLCLELQRMGRFLFLLDGLDEMATRVDRSVINESLREIDRLLAEGNNKYIVTCRTHFFQERIFEDYLVDYRIAYLMEWDRAQIDIYLAMRFGRDAQRWL